MRSSLAEGVSPGLRRAVAVWLGGSTLWVGGLIVVGGITRLTRSGLSMTDWKFTGEARPQSQAEWEAEFEKYRASPEFRLVNSRMSLDEFKKIWWMEYLHRSLGRGLGLVFALPALVFWRLGALPRPLARRVVLLMAAGGAQGFVGWWMVRSGLKEPPADSRREPRVSPYRLAAHLVSAFAIFGGLLHTTLQVALPAAPRAVQTGNLAAVAAMKALRPKVSALTLLLAATAFSGVFVAGLDAGRAYNTFPRMGDAYLPPADEYWEVGGWLNAFESTAAAQLHHRILALTSFAAATLFAVHALRIPALPRAPRALALALGAAVAFQASLGIGTLLAHVPVSLGSMHQAGALSLFALAISLLHATAAPATKLSAGIGRKAVLPVGLLALGGVAALAHSHS
ncbi:cytochrome oxidase assembly protein [Helicosporidium sp. ATCC 50920]|nr:cytochrome oxidase assembly protein [Helicosporidium sp. ATCC 50920]|eukprot:KDD76909.1 cytochrome oxidase assembly protein [Helicosporidium sp. ATCC 50920]